MVIPLTTPMSSARAPSALGTTLTHEPGRARPTSFCSRDRRVRKLAAVAGGAQHQPTGLMSPRPTKSGEKQALAQHPHQGIDALTGRDTPEEHETRGRPVRTQERGA